MLSPNDISSKKTGRTSSIWSTDSGYASGIFEDVKPGPTVYAGNRVLSVNPTELYQLGAPDDASIRQSHYQQLGLGIRGLDDLRLDDHIMIKKEEPDICSPAPQLRVCTAVSSPSSPDVESPTSPFEVRRSRAGKSTKLPSLAVGRLQAWINANRHYPYPDAHTKQSLAEECGITVKQVTTWFTNTRQRQLKMTDELSTTVEAGATHQFDTSRLNTTPITPPQPSRKGKKKDYSRSNGASPVEKLLSPSGLSPCASMSDMSSCETDNWQCTFCRKSLTAKSWRRHEETQHYPKHQWTCLATGPRLIMSSRSDTLSICAFCEMSNPDEHHFQQFHRISDCLQKDKEERTFGRPDHLQQHARNFHKITQPLSDLVRDAWRTDGNGRLDENSKTCGFCQQELPSWDARATHIATHFKAGMTMAQWRDRGSTPALSIEHNPSYDYATVDDLARMGATFAGPSTSRPVQIDHPHADFAHAFDMQPAPAAPLMPAAPGIPDLDYDPLWDLWGNAVITSGASEFTYNPATMPPTILHEAGIPIGDDVYAETDFYGNPIANHGWFQQQ